jgi:hypothetical protein
MLIFLALISLALLATALFFYFKTINLSKLLATRQIEIVTVRQEGDRIKAEAAKSLDDAQKLVSQQVADISIEAERIRQHYEAEAQQIVKEFQDKLSKAEKELASLNHFASLRNAEEEVKQTLESAISEATALRTQANALLEQTKVTTETERIKATEMAKTIYEQATACLNQATRDAGLIIEDAEKRAKDIAGEAYDSLRDKQLLERSSEAIRNIIEGYGDKYIIPTHSLLDNLAAEFGYTSAGESLKSARARSRSMVEQGEAATCDYVEANRRETAIRFVIDAFNGRVDAILSRVKRDNYGTLEQEIRDSFSLVNLNGKAFREARILESYLNARLDELRWAVVVQELVRRQLEEQRDIKARMRDEEKARREYEQQIRQAAKEEEISKKALEEKERELTNARIAFEHATAQEKVLWERKIAEMQKDNETLRQDLAAATEKKLTIAQQTKTGTVYVISNVGTFGEGIYKIGQTRRPNPQERIDELGDASVPFDFDVHAWIKSDNAPVLEHKLQKRFLAMQINKVNSRKEFFRVSLKEIHEEVERISQTEALSVVHWTEAAEASQYRESLDIEGDPQKLQKWLERQEKLADRELRLDSLRLTSSDVTESQTQDDSL